MLTRPRRDYIEKRNGKFVVLSESGKTLGTHPSREKALAQLRAVEYAKHKRDAAASMGTLELPGDNGPEGLLAEPVDAGHPAEDASAVASGGTDPGLNSDPLQPHELPERRSNPHHASDPMNTRAASGEVEEEHRYLAEQDSPGSPGNSQIAAQAEQPCPYEQEKMDAPGSPGNSDPGRKEWSECDPLGDLRAAERIGDEGSPGRLPREEYQAPPEAMRNGDPAPNPSAHLTIRPSATESHVTQQPDEVLDEGDPNQYEMQSTESRLHPNEGNEPGYYEHVSGQNGGPDNAYSKTDPAGDDDFLRAIGAGPTKSGEAP
jgi:hypothetical protein